MPIGADLISMVPLCEVPHVSTPTARPEMREAEILSLLT